MSYQEEFIKIRTTFDSDIASAKQKCISDLDSLISSLSSRLRSVPANLAGAGDIFDSSPTLFSSGIGDSKIGVYGAFVIDLTNAIQKASQSINKYISSGLVVNTEEQSAEVQSLVSQLSGYLSTSSSDASSYIAKYITNINTKFTDAYNSSISLAAKYYIRSATDSFLGAINRATSVFNSDIDKLVSIYNTYKMLPSDFYTDADSILTDIVTDYNNAISSASSSYTSSLNSYKYYSSESQTMLDASNTSVSLALTNSSSSISNRLSSVSSIISNKVDYVIAIATADLSSKLFVEYAKINDQLFNYVNKLSSRINDTRGVIRNQIKLSYVPSFYDGVAYRNNKASVYNSVSATLSVLSSSIQTDFESKTEIISTNYNTSLSNLQNNVIDYINDNSPGMTEAQSARITSMFSSITESSVAKISGLFTVYSNMLSSYLTGLNNFVTWILSVYYDSKPLIRLSGNVSFPERLSVLHYSRLGSKDVNDKPYSLYNLYTFTVENVGGSPWIGFFGIKFTEQLSSSWLEDYYTSKCGTDYVVGSSGCSERSSRVLYYLRHSGFVTVNPGESKSVTVQVITDDIRSLDGNGYSFKDMQDSQKFGLSWLSTIVIRTNGGIVSDILG